MGEWIGLANVKGSWNIWSMLRKFKDRPVRHNYGFFSSYIYLLSCKEMNLTRAYVFFQAVTTELERGKCVESSLQTMIIMILIMVCVCVCVCVLTSVCLFVIPETIGCQASPSMGFSRQECWSGLPFPPPGDLLDPVIEHMSPEPPALAGGFFTAEPPCNSRRVRKKVRAPRWWWAI